MLKETKRPMPMLVAYVLIILLLYLQKIWNFEEGIFIIDDLETNISKKITYVAECLTTRTIKDSLLEVLNEDSHFSSD